MKTGKSKAVVQVTLVNKGEGAYQRDVFGDFITIERSISADRARGGGYKLLNERGASILDDFLRNVRLNATSILGSFRWCGEQQTLRFG